MVSTYENESMLYTKLLKWMKKNTWSFLLMHTMHWTKSIMKKNRSYLPQHDKGHLQILRASIMLNGGKVKAFFLKSGKIK